MEMNMEQALSRAAESNRETSGASGVEASAVDIFMSA